MKHNRELVKAQAESVVATLLQRVKDDKLTLKPGQVLATVPMKGALDTLGCVVMWVYAGGRIDVKLTALVKGDELEIIESTSGWDHSEAMQRAAAHCGWTEGKGKSKRQVVGPTTRWRLDGGALRFDCAL